MKDAERVTGITQDEGKTREEMKVGGASKETMDGGARK